MQTVQTGPTRQVNGPRYILRWRFRGERAEAEYAVVLERLRRQGWRELGRWGRPGRFVVEFGAETPPDWAEALLAASSLR